MPHHKISDADVLAFNKQYPKLTIRYNELFHDRFLIIDDRELYLIGASLKDIGGKCFGFTKMDSREIRRLVKSAESRKPPSHPRHSPHGRPRARHPSVGSRCRATAWRAAILAAHHPPTHHPPTN